jgi:ATP-binding cassette subfamily F protein uup
VSPVPGGLDAWMAGLLAPPTLSPPTHSPPTHGPPTRAPAPAAPRRGDGPPIGRLLRDTEKQLTRLGHRRDTLHEALLATTDHVELHRLGADLQAVQRELDAAEERWLELADRAEE